MNPYQLQITAKFRPEVLERVLRLTRHRGFRVNDMNMSTQDNGQYLVIQLNVFSDRPISQLSLQLEKLLDVTQVQVLDQEQALKKIA
ncbi:MAG: acetolactate synthase 2 small subunit [Oceanisphaera sp.]|uniref:acetolactate synthase 2 small subunit n=1 Tax=Oceanisphaera sp. TaxID=1929979 RepID=UPI003F968102